MEKVGVLMGSMAFFFVGMLAVGVRGRDLKTQNVVLDVGGALRAARGEAEVERSESLEEGIPLLHRDVVSAPNVSYKQRVQERLKRDSARVAAIYSRLSMALEGVPSSGLRPKSGGGGVATMEEFESPVTSGIQQGSGEYFTHVGVGVPARDQLVVLDTGSDIVWIQCEPCSECYQQTAPIFNPGLSSTYAGLRCDSSLCRELDVSGCGRNGMCEYQVNYGDGSYTIGSFATETITLGKTSVSNVAIGCGHDNEGLFVGAAGLLGLGRGALSFPGQLRQADDKIFSYCLVDRDSGRSSTLQFGREAVPRAAVLAPMLKNSRFDTFYYVSVEGLSVGGRRLSLPENVFQLDSSGNGGLIVDSGTAVTRLQSGAYAALRDAFVAGTKNLPSTDGVSLFDTCYDLSNKDSVSIPTIAFHFPNGGSLSLPAKNYLVPVDTMGTFCFAFAGTSSSLSIVGNIQQQGIRVSYDTVNSLVGFAVNKC